MPTSLGPAEILVILVVALIVLGPKRLPEAARQVGKTLAEVRKWSQGIQDEVRNAMDMDSGPPTYPSPPPPEPTPLPTLPAATAETVVLPEAVAGNDHPPAEPAEPAPEAAQTVILPETVLGNGNGRHAPTTPAPPAADQVPTQQLDLPGEAGPPAEPPRN